MGWPQAILGGLIVFELGMALAKDGEPKHGAAANFSFVRSLISAGLVVGLTWWGGFYS